MTSKITASALSFLDQALGGESVKEGNSRTQTLNPCVEMPGTSPAAVPQGAIRRTPTSAALTTNARRIEASPVSFGDVIDDLNLHAFTLAVLPTMRDMDGAWMSDGVPIQRDSATQKLFELVDAFEHLRKREKPADLPSHAQRGKQRKLCAEADACLGALKVLYAENFMSANDADDKTDALLLLAKQLPTELKRIDDVISAYRAVPPNKTVDEKLGELLNHAVIQLNLISRARGRENVEATRRRGTALPDATTRAQVLAETLKYIADVVPMIERIAMLRMAPLSNTGQGLASEAGCRLTKFLAAALINSSILAQRLAGDVPRASTLSAEQAHSLVAAILATQQRSCSEAGATWSAASLSAVVNGWHAFRQLTTEMVTMCIRTQLEEHQHILDDPSALPALQETARKNFGYCAELLPIAAASFRQLRDELEFEWAAPVERSAEDRDALKFLLTFLEHEEFMTRATAACAMPWIDGSLQADVPVLSPFPAAAAPADPSASIEPGVPEDGPVSSQKVRSQRKLTPAQYKKMLAKEKREAKALQREQRQLRSDPSGDGAQAAASAIGDEAPSVGHQDVTATTTPLPLAVEAPPAELPALNLSRSEQATYLAQQWESIKHLLTRLENFCRTRYLATKEKTPIADGATWGAQVAPLLVQAQSSLRDASAVMEFSSHKDFLAAEHLPHSAERDALMPRVNAMPARLDALAAAAPLLTGRDFLDKWRSGAITLHPGVDRTEEILTDSRGPLCEIRARWATDLGGFEQQELLMHLHLKSSCKITQASKLQSSHIRYANGQPLVTVKQRNQQMEAEPTTWRLYCTDADIPDVVRAVHQGYGSAADAKQIKAALPLDTIRNDSPHAPSAVSEDWSRRRRARAA